MSSSTAKTATPYTDATQPLLNLDTAGEAQNAFNNSNIGGQVASGQMSVQDAINSIQNNPSQFSQASQSGNAAPGAPGFNQNDVVNQLLQNPDTINQVASFEALQNPTLAGIFNSGGQLSQAEGNYTNASNDLTQDRQALSGNDLSYGLQASDLQAYNQAAANTARQFGNSSNSLNQALANQGLSAGGSGSSAQAFSNVYGNQQEQLAGLQSNIAQNRINTAQQLAQSRTNADLSAQGNAQSYVGGLSSLGQNATQNAAANILNASQNNYNQNAGAANLGLENQGTQQSIADTQWQQSQASNPANIIGGIATGAIGALTGGIGGGVGAGIGNSISGNSISAPPPQALYSNPITAGGAGTIGGSGGINPYGGQM